MQQEQQEQDQLITRVDSPAAIAECLEALMAHSGASLLLTRPGSVAQPVVVVATQPGDWLLLDLGSARQVLPELNNGESFSLLGHNSDKVLRSCKLVMGESRAEGSSVRCFCPYPTFFEILQRRDTFRAELRLGMVVSTSVEGRNGTRWAGVLKNLSLGGCQVSLPLAAASLLSDGKTPLRLTFTFPDGTELLIEGLLRHEYIDMEHNTIYAGFEFVGINPGHERQLWVMVREIEREAARYVQGDMESLQPSPLFSQVTTRKVQPSPADEPQYATPMARRLAKVADYLGVQVLALRRGGNIDSTQLSLHADRLLGLFDEDREALLFATACLCHEPPLISHCLSVAVRLVDISAQQRLPQDLRKAMAASAMVHDLGRVLLPDDDLSAPPVWAPAVAVPGPDQREHVAAIVARLVDCRWLSASVVQSVVAGANERLDGSGYPRGLKGEDLHDLSRLMAVVDTVDALGRARPDGPPQAIDAIYRQLLAHTEAFDQRWVKLYVQHFGPVPIGSLVQYEGGELAWVLRLGADRQPVRVQLAAAAVAPTPEVLGAVLEGRDLVALGRVIKSVVAERG